MPKLAAGPPVLVRLVAPLPRPAFMRTETSRPGARRPSISSWWSEQALTSTPASRNSASRADGICEVSWIWPGAKPARRARSTSWSLEASMCRPSSRKSLRIPWFGLAFIAYRSVKPNGAGKASTLRAAASSAARS